jgi:NAD(P)-dependent dehydrogenase (short-subunit alcohol dehydrogenase family)
VALLIGSASGIGRALAAGFAEGGAEATPAGRQRRWFESACRDIGGVNS